MLVYIQYQLIKGMTTGVFMYLPQQTEVDQNRLQRTTKGRDGL